MSGAVTGTNFLLSPSSGRRLAMSPNLAPMGIPRGDFLNQTLMNEPQRARDGSVLSHNPIDQNASKKLGLETLTDTRDTKTGDLKERRKQPYTNIMSQDKKREVALSKLGLSQITSDKSFKKMLKKRKSLIEGILEDVENNNQNDITISPYKEMYPYDASFGPIYNQSGNSFQAKNRYGGKGWP